MDNTYEQRIKLLEEEVAYLHKDIASILSAIERINPEIHYHFTNITDNRPCADCKEENNTNLEDFI
jgi:hypothetical protein